MANVTVHLFIEHTAALCKNGWTDRCVIWWADRLMLACITVGGADWRHVENTIERLVVSRRRRHNGGQVLRDVPDPGLLPAVQEAQGADAENAPARADSHWRTAGLTTTSPCPWIADFAPPPVRSLLPLYTTKKSNRRGVSWRTRRKFINQSINQAFISGSKAHKNTHKNKEERHTHPHAQTNCKLLT